MNIRKTVSLYYVLSALRSAGMGFTMAIYSNFLRNAGLDELQINLVNVSFFTVIAISEIPTGLYADVYGRKMSFVVSCFLGAIGVIIYGFVGSFWGFIIAESVIAISNTFCSGAFDSWLEDSIGKAAIRLRRKIFTTRNIISGLSAAVTSTVGRKISDVYGLNIPFFAASILFIVCGIAAIYLMREDYFINKKTSFIRKLKEMRVTLRNSRTFTRKDLNFRFILIVGTAQMFACMAPNMEWPKIYTNLGLSNSENGWIGSLINIIMVIGCVLTNKICSYIKGEKKQLIFIQLFTGACIALTVSYINFYSVSLFFILHEVGRGMTKPIMNAYTQKCITSSKERATLSSFGSMTEHIGGVLGLITSGLIAKYYGIAPAWIMSGTVLVIVSLLLAKNYKQK